MLVAERKSVKPSQESGLSVPYTLSNNSTFKVSLNRRWVGKSGGKRLSHPKAWTPSKVTIEELAAHISKGYPWMPSILDEGARRNAKSANYAEVLALDIDGGMTLLEAKEHYFIRKHAALVIESTSSTPELNKFRVVFILDKPLRGHELIGKGFRYLMDRVGQVADRACKDASRFFYGGLGRKPFLLDASKRLSTDAITAFEVKVEPLKPFTQAHIRGASEDTELIRSALEAIAPYSPGYGRYPELLTMMAGVVNELGAQGERLLINWDLGRGEWGCDFAKKVRGLSNTAPSKRAGLGSLFWLAESEGWKRPIDFYARTFSADQVSKGSRFIGEINPPSSARLVAIKAPKGAGKTESITGLVQKAQDNDQRVIVLTHRISLTQALCNRFGVYSIYETRGNANAREAANQQGFGLCVNSLHPLSQATFNAEAWAGSLVVIDEAEQVLFEMLHGSTMRGDRIAILQSFKTLIRSAGRVIVADADLSPITIEAIKAVGEVEESWTLEHTYEVNRGKLTSYGRPEQTLREAEKQLKEGKRLLVMTDSQKEKSKYGTCGLQQRWSKAFPQLKIGRIDSASLALRDDPAFGCMNDVDAFMRGYDVVLCSPSVGTGVSIDLRGHFDSCFGFFAGVVAPDVTRQALARLREDVPRYIHVPKVSLGSARVAGGLTGASQIEASQKKSVAAALRLIYDACRKDIDSNALPGYQHAFSQYAARNNAHCIQYRESVISGLESEGWEIEEVDAPQPKTAEAEALTKTRAALAFERAEALSAEAKRVDAARELDEIELAALSDAKSYESKDQRREFEKAILTGAYGIKCTKDLYVLDQYGWRQRLKLHYLLTEGRQYLKATDQRKVDKLIKGGLVWGVDVQKTSMSLKVRALELLEIPKFVGLSEIHKESDEVVRLSRELVKNARTLKRVLGITIKKDEEPMVLVRRVLDLIGLKPKFIRKEGPRGKRVRVYSIEFADSKELANGARYRVDRAKVFNAWVERDEAREESKTDKEVATDQMFNDMAAQADMRLREPLTQSPKAFEPL